MGAMRFDTNKLSIGLIPVPAILELAMVFTKGGIKYLEENWRKGMAWSRIYTPMERHLAKWKLGQERDPENGCHHLLQVAWGCVVLYMYERWSKQPIKVGSTINIHAANDDRRDKLTDAEIDLLFGVVLTVKEEESLAKKMIPNPGAFEKRSQEEIDLEAIKRIKKEFYHKYNSLPL